MTFLAMVVRYLSWWFLVAVLFTALNTMIYAADSSQWWCTGGAVICGLIAIFWAIQLGARG